MVGLEELGTFSSTKSFQDLERPDCGPHTPVLLTPPALSLSSAAVIVHFCSLPAGGCLKLCASQTLAVSGLCLSFACKACLLSEKGSSQSSEKPLSAVAPGTL